MGEGALEPEFAVSLYHKANKHLPTQVKGTTLFATHLLEIFAWSFNNGLERVREWTRRASLTCALSKELTRHVLGICSWSVHSDTVNANQEHTLIVRRAPRPIKGASARSHIHRVSVSRAMAVGASAGPVPELARLTGVRAHASVCGCRVPIEAVHR